MKSLSYGRQTLGSPSPELRKALSAKRNRPMTRRPLGPGVSFGIHGTKSFTLSGSCVHPA